MPTGLITLVCLFCITKKFQCYLCVSEKCASNRGKEPFTLNPCVRCNKLVDKNIFPMQYCGRAKELKYTIYI